MNKLKLIMSVFLITQSFMVLSQDPYMTSLESHQLDNVNIKSKTVTFAGKTYKFELDVESSSYLFKADAATALRLSELEPGEVYYFEKMAMGSEMKSNNFKKVIFISKSKPSE